METIKGAAPFFGGGKQKRSRKKSDSRNNASSLSVNASEINESSPHSHHSPSKNTFGRVSSLVPGAKKTRSFISQLSPQSRAKQFGQLDALAAASLSTSESYTSESNLKTSASSTRHMNEDMKNTSKQLSGKSIGAGDLDLSSNSRHEEELIVKAISSKLSSSSTNGIENSRRVPPPPPPPSLASQQGTKLHPRADLANQSISYPPSHHQHNQQQQLPQPPPQQRHHHYPASTRMDPIYHDGVPHIYSEESYGAKHLYNDSESYSSSWDKNSFKVGNMFCHGGVNSTQVPSPSRRKKGSSDEDDSYDPISPRTNNDWGGSVAGSTNSGQLPSLKRITKNDANNHSQKKISIGGESNSNSSEEDSTGSSESDSDEDDDDEEEDGNNNGDVDDEYSPSSVKYGKDPETYSDGGGDGGSESNEDYSDDEDEGEDGYKPGGYHPVKVAEVYNQRYIVIKKLGWGHFSTVWMVKDRKASQSESKNNNPVQYFALKVQKSAEHYTEAAMDEVELLDCVATERERVSSSTLSGNDIHGIPWEVNVKHSRHVAMLKDSFFHTGPNGRHMCMVFNMLGCNLLSVIKAYEYRGIPISAVKKMVRGICQGLDFLHRKCQIIHTDLKPENVLLEFLDDRREYDGYTSADEEENVYLGGGSKEITVEELEMAIADTRISKEEKKRLRKKLKKLKQKERNRQYDRDVGDLADRLAVLSPGGQTLPDILPMLSDNELGRILDEQNPNGAKQNKRTSHSSSSSNKSGGESVLSPHRVLKRLNHSPFVGLNFSAQQNAVVRVEEAFRELAHLSSADDSEIESQLNDVKNTAEVTFLLRAYVPEGEIADNVSKALGIRWKRSEEKGAAREWNCELSLGRSDEHRSSPSTLFKIIQRSRKGTSSGERQVMSDLVRLISANLSGNQDNSRSPKESNNHESQYRCLPFSQFAVKFSVSSSVVVLSYLETQLPGVTFLTYKRDEGLPPLDSVVFGDHRTTICNHPLAMKVKEGRAGYASTSSNSKIASCIIGFDLRLIKEFAARPTVGEDGAASFKLPPGNAADGVTSWWSSRHSVYTRVKSFMGIDPSVDGVDLPMLLHPRAQGGKAGNSSGVDKHYEFKEEGKNMSTFREAKSLATGNLLARKKKSKSPTQRPPSSFNVKDPEVLKKTRAVVVDLGNACWTHRHFSEDIQTRQYRSPEVLIGSKYDTSADMWSLGCITFELMTGDLLFDPRAGEEYDRDEDHLAMFQELLGKMPKKLALGGKYSKNFFNRKGDLKHILNLKFWPMHSVLHEKYHFSTKDSREIADFLLPLLEFDPKNRSTALDCLNSDWLRGVD